MARSSSGPGYRPLKAETRVRISYGLLITWGSVTVYMGRGTFLFPPGIVAHVVFSVMGALLFRVG